MSRNTKLLLVVVAAALGLCLVACVATAVVGRVLFSNTIRTTRADTFVQQVQAVRVPSFGEAVSSSPLEYTLPAGYRQDMNMHVLGTSIVLANQTGGHGHLCLMEVPFGSGVTQTEMESRLSEQPAYRSTFMNETVRLKVVGQKVFKVQGQEATFTVSEGTNSENQPYRQMAGSFNSADGVVLVIIAGQTSTWDQAAMESFVASIR